MPFTLANHEMKQCEECKKPATFYCKNEDLFFCADCDSNWHNMGSDINANGMGLLMAGMNSHVGNDG